MESFTPLAPRARTLFHLQAFARLVMFWIPVIAVGGFLGAVFWDPLGTTLLVFTALFLRFMLALWWPFLTWRRWGWLHREDELLIRRGVLFRSITAIPIERVQHVDVRQGPLEQWLGLARIHVHTASGVGADGVVPGLRPVVAETLRDRIVRAAAQGDDGV